jgi:hypothetical protein
MDSIDLVTSGELSGVLVRAPVEGPVQARFTYDVRDPFAISLTMTTRRSPEPVTWTFSRELLEGGLNGGFGSGDVVVAPSPDDREVLIGIGGAADFAVVHLEAAPTRRFLDKTYRAVRPGRENEYLNIDGVVAKMLAT